MRRTAKLKRENETWLDQGEDSIPADELTDALDELYAFGPKIQDIRHAQEKLLLALASAKSQVVYYCALLGDLVGPILVAVSAQGVVAIEFSDSEETFLARLRSRTGAVLVHSPERVETAARQLREYLSGERDVFDLPLDLSTLTVFHRKVLLAVSKVPRGEVTTYGALARRMGRPKAARAVGQALGRNPIPILIPCHRVLASDGSLGGYSGKEGVRTKADLLRLEGMLF